jgi:hypothetical protein
LEKRGVMLAIRGIRFMVENGGSQAVSSYRDTLKRLSQDVSLSPLDFAYFRTWLAYLDRSAGSVKEEGHVKREDHEPKEEIRADPLSVKLSLRDAEAGDGGPAHQDADKVKG